MDSRGSKGGGLEVVGVVSRCGGIQGVVGWRNPARGCWKGPKCLALGDRLSKLWLLH